MDVPNEILLAKWINGDLQHQSINQLSKSYNLEELEVIMSMQQGFDLPVIAEKVLWEYFAKERTVNSTSRSKWISSLFLIAIFCLVIVSVYKQCIIDNDIRTKKGEQTEMLLPCGSIMHLAPDSNMKMQKEHWGDNRNIKLEGQAYFEITDGVPFHVNTKLGNVSTYSSQVEVWESGNKLKVVCFRGQVEVVTTQNETRFIKAGEYLTIDNSVASEIYFHRGETAEFLLGEIVYTGVLPKKIAEEIERFYGVKVNLIRIQSNKFFSGSLDLKDLANAAQSIAQAMEWNYELQDSKLSFEAK